MDRNNEAKLKADLIVAEAMAVFGWNGNIVEACRLDQSICNLEIDGMKIFI